MVNILSSLILVLMLFSYGYASQTSITDGEGYACMGDDKSRKQTEEQALLDAKRNTVEKVKTYLRSETTIRDFRLEKDVIQAYANARVKIIEVSKKEWYKDLSRGECFKTVVKAEVVPDEAVFTKIATTEGVADDASGPLNVKIWTDKKEYKDCDKIKVFLKGNKPFYARVVYRDAIGQLVQILPNHYRPDNYFNGNVVYEIPSGPDKFELALTPPYGSEEVRVFASTAELGDIQSSSDENVIVVQTDEKDLGIKSRSVKVVGKSGEKFLAAEFSENSADITTSGQCTGSKQISRKKRTEEMRMVIQAPHSSSIQTVAFSPDGKYVVTGASDKTIKLWDLDGKIIRSYSTPSDVLSVQCSPDGKFILSGSRDGSIILRDLSGEVIMDRNIGYFPFKTFFSSDGKHIISFSNPQVGGNGTVSIWDLEGKLLKSFSKMDDVAASWGDIRVSSDGKFVATVSLYKGDDSTIRLWKTDGTLIKTFTGIKGSPSIRAIAPGAKILAIHFTGCDACPSRGLELWNGEGTILARLTAESRDDYFHGYQFSSDGSSMMLKRSHRKWELWKKKDSQLLKIGTYSTEQDVNIIFSPDGKHILIAGRSSSQLLRASDGGLVRQLLPDKYYFTGIAALDTSCKRIVLANDGSMVELRDIGGYFVKRIGDVRQSLDPKAWRSPVISLPMSLSFSPDGKQYAIHWLTNTEIRSLDGSVSRMLSLPRGAKGEAVRGDSVKKIAFASDTSLGVFYNSGDIRIFDLNGSLLSKMTETGYPRLVEANFVQNGASVMTGLADRTIKAWNANGTVLSMTKVPFHGDVVFTPIAFSPDGRHFAAVDKNPNIYTRDGAIVASLDAPKTRAMTFSPDSRLLMTGGAGALRLWTLNGTLVKTMEDSGFVHLVAFGPNGKTFLTASGSGLRLWSIDGTVLKKFEGHANDISSAVYSPDGKYVLSAGNDTLCIWNLVNDEYVTLLRLGEEWIMYSPDGYFEASKNGGSLVAMAKGMKVWAVDQFAIKYNRPDILLKKLGVGSQALAEHYKNQYLKRLRKADLKEEDFSSDLHVPEVLLVQASQNDKFMDLAFTLSDSRYGLRKYNIFVNDVPLFGVYGKDVNGKKVTRTERIELTSGRNKIEISALNEQGAESYRTITFADYSKKARSNLYFVGFGISRYKDGTLKLQYADKDVKDLAGLYSKMKGKAYNDVFVRTYVNQDVTIDKIMAVKNFLQKTTIDDTVVLFIAGHGLHEKDSNATYYYLTYNTDLHDLAKTSIDFEHLENLLQGIPARNKLFLMDTCESGEIDENVQNRYYTMADARGIKARTIRGVDVRPKSGSSIAKVKSTNRDYLLQRDRYIYNDLNRRSGAIVFSSSRGEEFSYESDKIQNGFFTREIINALTRKEADKNFDNIVSTDELRDYVSKSVANQTGGLQNPTVDRDNLYQKFGFPSI